MPANATGTIEIVVDVIGEATHELSAQDTAAHVSQIPAGGTLLQLPSTPPPSDGDRYEFADIDGSCGAGNTLSLHDPNGHTIGGQSTVVLSSPFAWGRVRFNAAARVWQLASSSGAGGSGGVLGMSAVGDSLFVEAGVDKVLVPAGEEATIYAMPAFVAQGGIVVDGPTALQNGEQTTVAALVDLTTRTTSDEGHFERRATYFNNGITVENPQGTTDDTDVTTPPPLQNVGPGTSLNNTTAELTVIAGVVSLVVDNTAGAVDVEASASISLVRHSLGPAGVAPSLVGAIFTPNHGPISGGTVVTVTNAAGMANRIVGVFVGGEAAPEFTPISDTSFSFETPPGGAVGNVDIEIATRGGNATAAAAFHYDFTPAVRNPLIWLKYSVAGSVTVVGPNATSVTDQGADGNDFATGGPNAFTASDAHVTPPAPSIAANAAPLHALNTIPQPNTTYIIGYATGGGPSDFLGSADGIPADRQSIGVNGAVWYQYAGGAVQSGGVVDANAHVFAAIFDGASSEVFIDSSIAAVFSGNAGANSLVQPALGGSGNAGGAVTIEVICVAGHDTNLQIGEIFTYAGAEYGKPWA